jgi:tripartite-type tricarboxylate transporter receptor subunit TctC
MGYPSLNILGWYVFFAPPKTPPAMIDAWGNELRAVLKMPEVEKKMTEFRPRRRNLDARRGQPAHGRRSQAMEGNSRFDRV